MIDRAARDRAAEALENFRTGIFTNYELEDGWPRSSSDVALGQIIDQLWYGYDDNSEYRLDRSRIGEERDALYRRVVLFLRSSLEYEWPEIPRAGLFSLLLALATLGLSRVFSVHRRRRFRRAGDVGAWPFLRKADFRSAGAT